MSMFARFWILLSLLCGASLAQGNPFDYNVLGVIASSQNQKGVALIKQKPSGRVAAFREGQDIAAGCRIEKIFRKTVTFSYNSKFYELSVGDETPTEVKGTPQSNVAENLGQADGIERQGNTLKVTRSLKDNLVGENLNKILMQAAAVPHVENGRLMGFQLLEIDQGSIFDVAGLKNGDIITHINEQPINDAALAIKALSQLKAASSATFNYIRNRKPMELVIQIN
ncbi:MAG TPA: PDZ domain-containing protein [Oligoflexus sp.]|uniref:PDZ domain-containing protein n=1 Tax=Oligoflexus sp. TaxID=1971216 RepID=UPI002D5864A8|nr:PDZ domain-containing protein [Oligoflexus sp.]HYX33571.1 PDZ domain-containing protein [Oligoflexus sp.]